MTNSESTVGIDLGTTHSLCAVFRSGAPELIPNAHGEVLTPSVVGVLDDGQLIVGAAARELSYQRPDSCASVFKRWMGTEREFELGGQTFGAVSLSSVVLKALKADAEAYLGHPVTDAVVTVPAYFNEHQREATRRAAQMAGFEVRRILNEPTAAALTYGFHSREADERLCVFDLGGGTFDVTVMEIFEGTLEILSTAGESHLGGEDFTDRLMDWVLREHGSYLEVAEFREPLRISRLRKEAEHAKHMLATHDEVQITYPNEDGTIDASCPVLDLSAGLFHELSGKLLERLGPPLLRALRDARVTAGQIDEVILVGGATRLTDVRTLVSEAFGRTPLTDIDPDQVVALGAAVQAALINDEAEVDDMVMTDVCPFTLGVEITKEFGKQMVDGYFLPVIHRNTTIPVSREEHVATLVTNQKELVLRIYQGEARRTEDNLLLGELRVSNLPQGPAGQPVAVRFTYDLNGLLEVEAFVPKTGTKFQTLLEHHVKGLSDLDVERATAELQRLKFYPRDDLDNRRLVLFGERVLGEISPFERETLEERIDSFEEAMSAGDRDGFERARDDLVLLLSQLGHAFGSDDESGDSEGSGGEEGRNVA